MRRHCLRSAAVALALAFAVASKLAHGEHAAPRKSSKAAAKTAETGASKASKAARRADGGAEASARLALFGVRVDDLVDSSHAELRRRLSGYVSLHKREVAKGRRGRFVVAEGDHHGLGNRVNSIIAAFALALQTSRALLIHWPRYEDKEKCHESEHTNAGRTDADCDPAGIDDLFTPPEGVDWGLPKDLSGACGNKWARQAYSVDWSLDRKSRKNISNADQVEELAQLRDSAHWARYKNSTTVLCVLADRALSAAVTCESDGVFPADAWLSHGILQRYLLRPREKTQSRIQKALKQPCDVGVHLRKKLDEGMPFHHLERDLDDAMQLAKTFADKLGRQVGIFIATDAYSDSAAKKLLGRAEAFGARVLSLDMETQTVTRSTIAGWIDATAENELLSHCHELLPRQTGASTFHDIALARLVSRWGGSGASRDRTNASRVFHAPEQRCVDFDTDARRQKRESTNSNSTTIQAANHTR
ncbi:hypothetical protein M885DRAFT_534733 [Pelagophyceae sp. CCMP2097]|nr:hypothetical protein M885DRAFT_534733 [Pelagophyceae sp. CCMP2097]